ncbi:hypothetical protein IFM89_001742 [Coptis chinensis]|uniref:Pentatricopeptide repeat-containing protein n=1 Tax=Coptis chinensis TaxID=261450 RepID=A0A835HIT8_9MAGN|nr:hypothetical protein IFM89_001742 [Coptis chinensis]
MSVKDVVTWNAVISGYVQNGLSEDGLRVFELMREALDVFEELKDDKLNPNEPTLVSTSSACGHLGALDIGKKIHIYAEERNFQFAVTLGTALVDMYSKCGCITEAREVFNKMPDHDVMTWTSMIGGLAVHGHAKEALDLFMLMLDVGPRPDGITFVGVLCACSHAGLVEQDLHYFKSMRHNYNITPKIEHHGRAGRLEEAHEIISSMEIQPNAIVWKAFLSACRLHSNVKLAEFAVHNLFKLQSDNCGDYVLVSNIYASKGRWDDVKHVRKKMDERGVKKIPGLSLI